MDVPASNKPQRVPRQLRAGAVLTLLGALLVLALVLSVGSGAVRIAPEQVVAILLEQIGLTLEVPYTRQQAAVLLAIRLPRVLLGTLIGASLAVAGAAMQGLFRNPLADPGLLGISSGAALAAAIVLVLGVPLLGYWLLPAAAFIGSLAATLFVYSLATRGGRTQITTMLLAGIALSALANAGVGFLTFIADDAQLRDLTFWTMGSLGGATWRSLTAVAPFMLAALILIPRFARALNLFLLGEEEARHLGIDVEMSKIALIFLTAFAVGAAVSVAGIIGFVGLVVPHLVRLAIGPDHRVLLPASALLGASLLLVTDLLSRTIAAPAELPIGVITSVIGGPFFLWLLLRFRNRGGLL
jgi:iron complex transport system permease protein